MKPIGRSHPFGAALALLLYAGVAAAQSVTLADIHGLAYSTDDNRLIVALHEGMAVYSAGRWSKASAPQHDYMGFSATKNRFYSGGHPAPGSGLTNPLGLIVSGDGGRTWDKGGLDGESDFHTLGTSYETNAIYVYSPGRNSRMDRPGIYSTLNGGFRWTRLPAQGLSGTVRAIAVHPSNPRIVAIATSDGLFLSTDGGDGFDRLAAGQALAALFDLDAENLLYSMYDGAARLYRHSLKARSRAEVALPSLTRDAVSQIAQNPAERTEYAIATSERSVFLTRNMGKNWTQIAQNGRTN